MNKLPLLIKTSLRNQFARVHSDRGRLFTILSAVGIVGLIVIGMRPMIAMTWGIAGELQQFGLLDLFLLGAILLPSCLCFFTGIYSAPAQLFMCTDYDLLLSLPVKTSTVLMSKLSSQLFYNLCFTVLVSLPLLIIYGVKTGAGPQFYLFAFVSLPFIPLMPLTLAALVGAIIARIAARFNRSHAVVTNLTFALLVAPVGVCLFPTSSHPPSLVANLDEAIVPLKIFYPPAGAYFEALRGCSLISLILFIALSVGVFFLFCNFLARYFKTIYSSLGATSARADYKFKELSASTAARALFVKELKGYLCRPAYILNTLVGMITLVLIGLGAACLGDAKLAALKSIFPEIPFVATSLLIASFFSATTCTTACSISLEGRSLWILKSSPLSPLRIFKEKLLLNLVIALPLLTLSSVLFAIGLRLDFGHWVLMMAVTFSYSAFIASAGLLINLRFPNLEFRNQTAVVKQSASALLTFLVALISLALPVALYEYWFAGTTSYELYCTLLGVSLLAITALLWQVIKSKGILWFQRL